MGNYWEEIKGMTTKGGMDGDGTGCLDRHESRLDTKTTNTVTTAVLEAECNDEGGMVTH